MKLKKKYIVCIKQLKLDCLCIGYNILKYNELVQIRKNYDFSKLGTNRNGKKILNPDEIYDNDRNLIELNEVNPWSLW